MDSSGLGQGLMSDNNRGNEFYVIHVSG